MLSQKFGRLLVVAKDKSTSCGVYWLCLCDCGEKRIMLGRNLRTGKTKSCNCYQRESASKFHSGPEGECAKNQCYNNYRHLARARKIKFELTKEQFFKLTKENCFYCGCPPLQSIEIVSGNGAYLYNGVDRFDNTKHYTLENCVPSCGTHNKMKLNMTAEDFISACRSVVEYQDQKVCKALVA